MSALHCVLLQSFPLLLKQREAYLLKADIGNTMFYDTENILYECFILFEANLLTFAYFCRQNSPVSKDFMAICLMEF